MIQRSLVIGGLGLAVLASGACARRNEDVLARLGSAEILIHLSDDPEAPTRCAAWVWPKSVTALVNQRVEWEVRNDCAETPDVDIRDFPSGADDPLLDDDGDGTPGRRTSRRQDRIKTRVKGDERYVGRHTYRVVIGGSQEADPDIEIVTY